MKKIDIAIIGAGSGGLSARREVAKKTNDYLVINSGPLGTTCARVGCMPSKVLIQVANDFHRRESFVEEGILGGEKLGLDGIAIMKHVRKLRDRFVRGVTEDMTSWSGTNLLQKKAKFIDKNTLDCEGEIIQANKIIIATGSSPSVPDSLLEFKDFLITTDQIFELETLPKSLAVIGLGVIGLELGQAMHRLGVDVMGIGRRRVIAGISDPEISEYTLKKFSEEMNLSFTGIQSVERVGSKLLIKTGDKEILVEKVLVTSGRTPNWKSLELDKLGLELDENKRPVYCRKTFKLNGHDHLYVAGDITGEKPILHEASDEGKIAGFNAVNGRTEFQTRTELNITFTDPNIADVGKRYHELVESGVSFETGKVSFEGQGRSIVKLKEKGLLHVYGEKSSGLLLGAEMFGPDAEHLGHLLSWAISQKMTVNQTLALPFYHPVIEEGLRTALRDLRSKVDEEIPPLEIYKI
jgi:dihydrolipoamide dehydrogenase